MTCRLKLALCLRESLRLILFTLVPLISGLTISNFAFAAYKVEIDAPKEIKALLTDHLDLVRYQKRDDISEDQLKFMIETVNEKITQLTSTQGYFSPTTEVKVDDGKTPVIHLTVDLHQRTIVSSAKIEVVGPVETEVPERIPRVQRNWSLPVGAPFQQSTWDDAKQHALRLLQYKRFPAAKIVDSQARIDPDEHDAQLSVKYDSGPTFTLGPLQITGARRYPVKIIENVNPLAIGEEYDIDRLLYLQRQIQNTNYYGNVIVGIDDDPAHAGMVPVKVQVTEFAAQRIRTGVGYDTDTGAHVQGRYTNYNVFDKAYVFDSQLKLEQRSQAASLELDMPPDERSFVNGIVSSYTRTTSEGVDLRSLQSGLKRTRSFENYDTTWTLTYYRDQLRQDIGATLPPNTVVFPGEHQALVPGFAWTRRDVDDQIFPSDGDIVTIQAGVALKGLLTDQTFMRLYSRYKKFIPMAKRDIVIFRIEGGAISSAGTVSSVPASLLFRAGGVDSVRGYSYDSIGTSFNGTVYPTKFLMTASAEYQHWFTREWGAAVFYDVGTATNSWADKETKVGIGPGIRWRSPVGPVNLDLGYGVQAKQFRPHISLGIAF
ncbi:autotransporter assembly complex protein TamA [Glaciimonas soli]|uniref:BamA/TamA family outer membrane protein n=1 Tax=Glaciimonas soli TaxID=2590999 RepID=A0A843YRK0_9BURK|nr:BamA/TamA family outer membrane protein [Glaciimonas soli]